LYNFNHRTIHNSTTHLCSVNLLWKWAFFKKYFL